MIDIFASAHKPEACGLIDDVCNVEKVLTHSLLVRKVSMFKFQVVDSTFRR